jgi:hypothetical protein
MLSSGLLPGQSVAINYLRGGDFISVNRFCGLARNITELTIARAIAGVGGAGVSPYVSISNQLKTLTPPGAV